MSPRLRRNLLLTGVATTCAATLLLSTPIPASAASLAKYVLGPSNYTLGSAQAASSGYNGPLGVAVDITDHRVFVVDQDHNRIVMYQTTNGLPSDNTIDAAIGQSTTSSSSTATTQAGMNRPAGVAYDDLHDRLYVSDMVNNRVLVFDAGVGTLATGMNAAYVIGQADFVSGGTGTGAAGLSGPRGLVVDETNNRLYVTDYSNNRVLVYNTASLGNGMSASYVLGQANMSANNTSVDQSTLGQPFGIALDATHNRLFVSGYSKARVLVFDVSSLSNGMAASNVLGQSTFTGTGYSASQSGMAYPTGVAYNSSTDRLYIADEAYNRILRYDVSSITNGKNAEFVFGQSNYTGSSSSITQSGLSQPQGIALDPVSQNLIVADYGANRVLFIDGDPVESQSQVSVSVNPSMVFAIAGYNAGTCNGATVTETNSTASAIPLNPALAGRAVGAQTLTVTSNSGNGYTIFTRYSGALSNGVSTIADVGSNNAAPAAFPSTAPPTHSVEVQPDSKRTNGQVSRRATTRLPTAQRDP
jgi:DNA-binding beta-propeller fold protein YncE